MDEFPQKFYPTKLSSYTVVATSGTLFDSVDFSNFPGAGDVWLSLRGTTYQNNSNVTLEDIGENDTALLCRTNFTACCVSPDNGSWFFPNGTRVFSYGDFYRTRGEMVVHLNRRRGGVEGIYRCEIPDSVNIIQTIYIGVYTTSTGESALLLCSTIFVLYCIYVAEE